MKLNSYKQPIYQTADLIELLYIDNGGLSSVLIEDSPESQKMQENGIDISLAPEETDTVEQFDSKATSSWRVPDEVFQFDPYMFCVGLCKTPEERDRVDAEFELFVQKGMLDLLCVLKYIVDTLRKHKIVWGVGRGSSVSSYVLFLLGVHKINSIKYGLDFREFLR